jgi:hypothetical protein
MPPAKSTKDHYDMALNYLYVFDPPDKVNGSTLVEWTNRSTKYLEHKTPQYHFRRRHFSLQLIHGTDESLSNPVNERRTNESEFMKQNVSPIAEMQKGLPGNQHLGVPLSKPFNKVKISSQPQLSAARCRVQIH